MNKNKNIESIYPLSPMQQGMLFHTLYAPNSGVYFEQLSCTLYGNLNVLAFQQAWQKVVERHSVLRTLFVWEQGKQPLQIVCKQVNLPWTNYDWQEQSESEQQEQLEAFLKIEREQGFELDRAPLMRCTLIKLQENIYQFICSYHHLLLDGWCWSIIFQEVLSFYEAFNQGQDLYLAPSRPYRDYIDWLQKQDRCQAQAYWQQALKGFTTPTPLVVDKAASQSDQKPNYDEQKRILSTKLTAALQSLAQQHHLTLSTLVQGAWALLLNRYSGESDVVFGATVSGRPATLARVESMVGLFINTLPMRVQISQEAKLLPWLKQLQIQQIEQQQYSYTSLVDIKEWSDVSGEFPLFESIVVFENYPLDVSLQQGDGDLEIRNVRSFEQTNYPLTLVVVPGSELSLQISYDRDRFDAATISRMLKHFQTLLESTIVNRDRCLSDLSILTEAERHQLFVNWNDIHAKYPQDKCIHQLFEEQVKRTPDAVAVVFEDRQLTYRELNSRANQLAHYLQGLGVGTEVLVGICVDRSLEMIIGLLGILKAGGAYVPLDPSYPQERLAFMLEDSQVSFILTQQSLIDSLPEHHAKVICLDSDREAIAQYSIENPLRVRELGLDGKRRQCGLGVSPSGATAVQDSHSLTKSKIQNPSNLAYVIYTSGSTGKPKGVLVSHDNVARLFSATQNWFNFNELDTWTLFHSYAFDFSVWEIWGALLYGGRLIVVPYWVSRSPETFYDLLCKERVTVLNQTPSAFRQLIRVEESSSTTQELSLRLVIFGGEALELQSLKPWFERHGDRIPQLVNMYGITETTVHVTYRPLTIADLNSTGSVIGRPIPDLQVYILDRHLQPVPIGVPGEMWIGGAGLARGYLNRPDLTTQKFINFELPIGTRELNSEDQSNPKSKTAAQKGVRAAQNPKSIRLYKSGDLARYLPNGDIEYLGRIDNQVKIRGFRIELGEIEAILARHPNVWENAIVDWEDNTGDKRLVAYIVPNGEQPTTNELRDFLKQQLPEHMIPSAFVMLESLPLTPNGKVDRRVLPAPDTSRRSLAEGFISPRNSTEETLARLWAEVLGVERVSIYDNFFALGGHSLRATQLMSRLKQTFSVELPLRTLFESPTLVELAELVVARQLEQADSDALEQILNDVNKLSEHEVKQLSSRI